MDIENFTVHIPTKLIVKKGGVADIVDHISQDGHKKIIFIYGQTSAKRNGLYDKIVQKLKNTGIEWSELEGVRPNPELSKVIDGINATRKNNTTAVLALGGGSVFDTAKAVALTASLEADEPAENVWQFYELKRTPTKALKIYGSLTLSATGSEMNQVTVIQKDSENKKWSIRAPFLFPTVSIIDPEVQYTLPPIQQANGFVDSMIHVLDSISNTEDPSKVETTFNLGTSLIRTILKCGKKLHEKPDDYETRANFCLAATYAYNGLSAVAMRGGCNAVHTLQRPMSAIDPKQWHGEGLAVCFPAFVRTSIERGERVETFNRIARDGFGVANWEEMLTEWNKIIKQWGHASTLAELFKITEEAELKKLKEKLFEVSLQKPICGFFPNNRMPDEFLKRAYEIM